MNAGPTGTTGRPTRLDALLSAAAREYPDRPAVSDGDRVRTYAELDALVADLAGALASAGVREGDHVGVYQHRGLDAVAVIHALLRLGAVAAPLEVTDPVERTARMADAGLALLVASPATAAAAERVRACRAGRWRTRSGGRRIPRRAPGHPRGARPAHPRRGLPAVHVRQHRPPQGRAAVPRQRTVLRRLGGR
ncbi:acyl--CoA ligase [Nocardiopsis exhalans]|uniref:Acyl--CoA ligase n=1 Tax=Nocardiopsis exhalans TaxID=163604 RepID=A0ABY5DDC1_9ACTN|nr:class I adenylate-forming enzyme family protein [Nocardiopsis exhalans]USY22321.1 acyl--CoA ligase [Nocardiopsis exhalans]